MTRSAPARSQTFGQRLVALAKEGAAMYVGRRLLNERQLRRWWSAQRKPGEPGLDLNPHITVAYSRRVVSLAPDDGLVVVPPSAMRGFRVLGKDHAVVLEIDGAQARDASSLRTGILDRRFAEYKAAGATWDHESYTPHMTLFYLGEGQARRAWSTGPLEHPALPDFPLVFGRELRGEGDGDVFTQPGADAAVEKAFAQAPRCALITRASWLLGTEDSEAPDEWLYHVTSEANASRILRQGFIPDVSRTVHDGVSEEQSQGRTFLTERAGVGYWRGRVGASLGLSETTVLAVPRAELPDVQHDAFGTNEAGGHQSYWVEGGVAPSTKRPLTVADLLTAAHRFAPAIAKRDTSVASPPIRRGLQWLSLAGQRRAEGAAERYARDLVDGRSTTNRVLRDERRDRQLDALRRRDQKPGRTLIETLTNTYRRRLERHFHNVEHVSAEAQSDARLTRQEWDEAIEEYQREGGSRSLVTKTWETAEDEKVRHAHAELHGVTLPYDGIFDGEHGPVWGPPDGYLCRCRLRVEFPVLAEKSGIRTVADWLIAKFARQSRVPRGVPRGGRWAGQASARAHAMLSMLPADAEDEHFISIPFTLHQRFEHERAFGRAIERKAKPTRASVAISDLHATQPLVHREGVRRWIDGRDSEQRARVTRDRDGRAVIEHGHHEATAAYLRGETHLDADVYDLTADDLWKSWEPTDLPEHVQKALDAQLGAEDVQKSSEEQRLVTGWALVCTEPDGSPLVDMQGDIVEIRDVERAAHRFMLEFADAGLIHRRDGRDPNAPYFNDDGTEAAQPIVIGRVVESLVVTPELKAALRLPPDTPLGWLVTVHVTDDATWARVKSGELRMFSIGGRGMRSPVNTSA